MIKILKQSVAEFKQTPYYKFCRIRGRFKTDVAVKKYLKEQEFKKIAELIIKGQK